MERASHEGRIGARVGELLEVPCVSDPTAGHELGVWERAPNLAQEVEVGARGHSDPGEVEDDDRAEPRVGGESSDVERLEGAECGVGGVGLTGAEVEGEHCSAGVRLTGIRGGSIRLTGFCQAGVRVTGSPPSGIRLTADPGTSQSNSDREPLERDALIGGGQESLEPHDHPCRSVPGHLVNLLGGGDAGIHPQLHVRQPGRDRPSQLPLRRSIDDCVEIGDIKLPEPEPFAKGSGNRGRIPRRAGRELRCEWRVTVAISRTGVHGTTTKYVQDRNYAHRSVAARVGIHGRGAR